MELTTERSLNLSEWYYNEASGIIVYFKKRLNDRYDAHDILTDRKVKKYTNLTLERIRKLFIPYARAPISKPIAQHADRNLAVFEGEVRDIAQPSDPELHGSVTQFLAETRKELKELM